MLLTPTLAAHPIGDLRARRLRDAAIVAVLIVVGTVLTWVRVPGGHQDRVWAEDGTEFLLDQVRDGTLDSLFRGYTGYQHLLPRLLAAALTYAVPLPLFAVAVFLVCSAIVGVIGAAVYLLSVDTVPWVPARIALAAITFLIPLAAQEVAGNLADLHTYLMWLAPWLLMYRPRTWGGSALCAAVAFVVVMSEIQAVLFIFLVLLRLRRSDRRTWPVFVLLAAGAAVQLLTALTIDRDSADGGLSPLSLGFGWLINTVLPLAVSDPVTVRSMAGATGLIVPLAMLVPIAASAVYALIRGGADQRTLVIALTVGSGAVYAGSTLANSAEWFRYAEVGLDHMDSLLVNSRYGVASGMMLIALVPVAASIIATTVGAPGSRTTRLLIGGGASALVVVVLAVSVVPSISLRGEAGTWSTAAADAVRECDGPSAQLIALPVAPNRQVQLTCAEMGDIARPWWPAYAD